MLFFYTIVLFQFTSASSTFLKCSSALNVNVSQTSFEILSVITNRCRDEPDCTPSEEMVEMPSGGFILMTFNCTRTTPSPTAIPVAPTTTTSRKNALLGWLPDIHLPRFGITIPREALIALIAVALIALSLTIVCCCPCCKCSNVCRRRRKVS